MMRPFRALVYHKDEIRNWKARLEAEVKERVEAKTPEPEAGPGKEMEFKNNSKPDATSQVNTVNTSEPRGDASSETGNQPANDKSQSDIDSILSIKNAVDDIACLVKFIEDEVEARIAYLRSNNCERIIFTDIWLLFKPGDFVLRKDKKQGYRVFYIEYLGHNMRKPSPRDFWKYGSKARVNDFPIQVHCVSIDYGERIGPVSHCFKFDHFTGEKNILSFNIIPLRLAQDTNILQEALIKRGSTFIEVCGAGRRGIPMHYSGPDISEDTPEEVDSQVVIDFENCFAELGENGNPMKWKSAVRNIDTLKHEDDRFYESDSSETRDRPPNVDTDNECIPKCCAYELTYNDLHVENRRRNEFIHDQLREQGPGFLTISSQPLQEVIETKDFITDNDRLITTFRVLGFIMRNRKWSGFTCSCPSSSSANKAFSSTGPGLPEAGKGGEYV